MQPLLNMDLSYMKDKSISKSTCHISNNRPFSYSKKESGSKDISLHSVELPNAHNTDRSSDETQSNLVYENV